MADRLKSFAELKQATSRIERESREKAPLRLVTDNQCPDCARLEAQITSIAESYERHIAELSAINDAQGKELGKKLREITRLKNEKRKDLEASKDYTVAAKVFRYWVQVTGRSDSCVFGEDRVERVLWALSKYEPRFICEAIKGYAVDPYIDQKGKRHNDLTLICRSSSKLEDGHDRYLRWKQRGNQ